MSNEVKQDKPFVREAKLTDIAYLADNMRECDKQEVFAMSGITPEQAFLDGYSHSDTPYVVEWRGKAIAMFGVSGDRNKVGIPWMLATNDIKGIRKQFIRGCRPYLEAMHTDYPVLTNYVWAENSLHIAWLKWLGFKFADHLPLGRNGEMFIHFYKETDYVRSR